MTRLLFDTTFLIDAERTGGELDDVIATIPVLDYDVEVAEAHAELLVEVRSQGKPRGAHDLIIAATARAFDRTVVSADDTAFHDLPGVEVRSRP